MRFFKQFSVLFLLLFVTIHSFCQDISGEWIGEIYLKNKKGEYTIYFPVYFEISHDTITNKITGANVTKSFDSVIADCLFEGVYDQRRLTYSIIETKATNVTPEKALKQPVLNIFNVKLEKAPEETLEGTCTCIDPLKSPLCFEKLRINLKRYKPK